jgi:hypothetical protein
MGLFGYFVSDRSIFFFVGASAIPALLALRFIKPKEIDCELARGGEAREDDGKPSNILALLEDKPLIVFLVRAVLFHFANAAMLPLLGELFNQRLGTKCDDVHGCLRHHHTDHYQGACDLVGPQSQRVGKKAAAGERPISSSGIPQLRTEVRRFASQID